jgi:hypothetical protein
MRALPTQQQQKFSGRAGRLVWRCTLIVTTLAALTACQNTQLQSVLANAQEESAAVQEVRTEGPAASTPPAEQASLPQPAAPDPAASAPQPPTEAASAPQSSTEAASRDYAVRWLRPQQDREQNDGVEIIDHGWLHGVQLIITSSAGTGAVEVQPVRTVWRNPIQVQFQYAPDKPFDKLERIYLQVVDSAPLVGEQGPGAEPADSFVVWQRGGALCVDLPAGWLHVQETLHIAWADRLRSSPGPSSSPKMP